MPRFNANKWTPGDDTSPGRRTDDPSRVVLNWHYDDAEKRFGCPCGCNGMPQGKKTKFAMGHDARLRGILIRAHLMAVEIRYIVNGVTMEPMSAMEVAKKYDWKEYLDTAVLRREGKNREVLSRALGSERLVKVGRWEYTGQVAAVYRTGSEDMLLIEYVNKAGDVRQARVPASEAPLAQEATT
jgi:hypothetical protein